MHTFKATSTYVAKLFFDHWLIPFGILTYLLMDNGKQCSSKFIATILSHSVLKHLRTTAYHLQTNCQAERCNMPIIARLQHYVNTGRTRILSSSCLLASMKSKVSKTWIKNRLDEGLLDIYQDSRSHAWTTSFSQKPKSKHPCNYCVYK